MYWDSSILCYKNNHAERTTRASARELELHVAHNCLGQLILIDVTVLNVVGGCWGSKEKNNVIFGRCFGCRKINKASCRLKMNCISALIRLSKLWNRMQFYNDVIGIKMIECLYFI